MSSDGCDHLSARIYMYILGMRTLQTEDNHDKWLSVMSHLHSGLHDALETLR